MEFAPSPNFLAIRNLRNGKAVSYARFFKGKALPEPFRGFESHKGTRIYSSIPFCTVAWGCAGGTLSVTVRGKVRKRLFPVASTVTVFSGGKKVGEGKKWDSYGFLLSKGVYRVRIEETGAGRGVEEFGVELKDGRAVQKQVNFPKGIFHLKVLKAEGQPLESHLYIYYGKKKITETLYRSEFIYVLDPGRYRAVVVDKSATSIRSEFDIEIEKDKILKKVVRLAKGTLLVKVLQGNKKPLKSHIYVYSGKKRVAQALHRTKTRFLLRPMAYRVQVVNSSSSKEKKEFRINIRAGETIQKKVVLP